MSDSLSPSAPLPPALDLRRLLLQAAAAIAAVMALLALAGWAFREPLKALGVAFVRELGGPGVTLGYLLPDALTVPMPADGFGALALVGGMGFAEVVAWASAGSLVGGALAWLLGRVLRRTAFFARFMGTRGAEIEALVARHGVLALAAAALTPLPYSIACYAAGALDMPFRRFALVSLLRVPRVGLYLALVKLGLVTLAL